MSSQPLQTHKNQSGSAPHRQEPPLALAQKLVEQLTLSPNNWHRLKSNRHARALEQAAVAIVYLLKDQPQEALIRLQQAVGWLDRSISAPPCPSHGEDRKSSQDYHQTSANHQTNTTVKSGSKS